MVEAGRARDAAIAEGDEAGNAYVLAEERLDEFMDELEGRMDPELYDRLCTLLERYQMAAAAEVKAQSATLLAMTKEWEVMFGEVKKTTDGWLGAVAPFKELAALMAGEP